MGKYRLIEHEVPVVIAEQFLPPYNIPAGVINVYQGTNNRYSGEIWTVHEIKISVKPGDWIIKEARPGTYSAVPDAIFNIKYEPA